MSTFEDVMGEPAWKRHPSWYLVATNDEAIPADAERMFAQRMGAHTVEVPSSHLAMVSHPDEVVKLIETAANATADAWAASASGSARGKHRASRSSLSRSHGSPNIVRNRAGCSRAAR